MGYVLDLDILRKKLSRARIRKDIPKYLLKEPPVEVPENLQYLIDNVLNPLSNGQHVHSADIDFSRFNRDDLVDMYDYYMEHFFDGTRDWYNLKNVYKICNNSEAQTLPVSFL